MQKIAEPPKKAKKLPPWAPWAIGYAVVVAAAVGLVYFWRVAFMLKPAQFPAAPATLGVLGIFSLLYGVLFLLCRFCKAKPCLQAGLCIVALGLLFCFSVAPMQVPDESRHFTRAYAVSTGHFDYDYDRGYPNDVNLLLQYFPKDMNHNVTYGGGLLPTAALVQYKAALQSGEQAGISEREPIQYMVVPYLLPGAFMGVARLFGCTALGQLYAARIANLLLYAAICALAFRNCNKYRGVFFAVALLPQSLFMAASCTVDSIMLALCYLMISYFCKDEILNIDVIIFGIALVMATTLKLNNIVLAAMLLLIPKERWKSRLNPRLATLAVFAAGLLLYFGFSAINEMRAFHYPDELPRGSDPDSASGPNPGAQVLFILRNPFSFVVRALLTLYEEAAFVFKLGLFGTTDMHIPLVSGLSVVSLGAASALGIQQKEDTKTGGLIALFLAFIGYCAAVLLGIYVLESNYQSIRITGLQPRYFLPAFLLLFMFVSILLGRAVRPRLAAQTTMQRTEQITLWVAVAIAFLAVVFVFQGSYIGQWLPKAEGGWKLINLFGWVPT